MFICLGISRRFTFALLEICGLTNTFITVKSCRYCPYLFDAVIKKKKKKKKENRKKAKMFKFRRHISVCAHLERNRINIGSPYQ